MKSKQSSIPVTFIGEIIGLIMGLGVVIYLLPHFAFITNAYYLWLPIGIATAIISAVVRIIGHLIGIWPIQPLTQIISLGLSFYSVWQLRLIFPFNFENIGYPGLESIMQLALLASLFGLALAMVVNLIKLVTLQR